MVRGWILVKSRTVNTYRILITNIPSIVNHITAHMVHYLVWICNALHHDMIHIYDQCLFVNRGQITTDDASTKQRALVLNQPTWSFYCCK